MLRILILTGTAILLAPAAAFAGDPCPIDFHFYDLGSPAGVDNGALLDALASQAPWLGISFNHNKRGVIVKAVTDGSPSAKAGLKIGDLIGSMNGTALKTRQDLDALLDKLSPGGAIKLALTRDGKTLSVDYALGRRDPVMGKVINHASSQDCNDTRRKAVDPTHRAALLAKIVKKSGALQCKNAHRKLKKNPAEYAGGDILVVRNATEILFTMPGWHTVCAKSADVDGAKLTKKVISRLFKRLTAGYVRDRHANP